MSDIQRQYIGARYVPQLADPILWNASTEYEYLTMVTDADGNSWISRKNVPANLPLEEGEFWAKIGSYTAQIANMEMQISNVDVKINTQSNRITAIQNDLGKMTTAFQKNSYWADSPNNILILHCGTGEGFSSSALASFMKTGLYNGKSPKPPKVISTAGSWTGTTRFIDLIRNENLTYFTNIIILCGFNEPVPIWITAANAQIGDIYELSKVSQLCIVPVTAIKTSNNINSIEELYTITSMVARVIPSLPWAISVLNTTTNVAIWLIDKILFGAARVIWHCNLNTTGGQYLGAVQLTENFIRINMHWSGVTDAQGKIPITWTANDTLGLDASFTFVNYDGGRYQLWLNNTQGIQTDVISSRIQITCTMYIPI